MVLVVCDLGEEERGILDSVRGKGDIEVTTEW